MTNPPHNVELEAAKFLHKLIQDSKDEPKKLATKLHVILQHMRSSGKENSMPYQVISRAMETVIKQHELDIEALMSLRHPMAPSGAQLGESGSSQVVGSSPRAGGSKDPNTNLAGNELSKPDIYPSSMPQGGHDTPNTTGGAAMVHGMMPSSASSYPLGETGVSVPKHFASSSYDNHGFAGKMLKEGIETFPSAAPSMDPYTNKPVAGGLLDHEGVNLLPNPNKPNQVSDPVSAPEMSMSRNVVPRDTGKAPLAQAGLPFKEHHLKQLRAQCLVFLAFRNGLMPKKLHLEIALGNFFPKEDGPRRDTNDHKGKEQSVHEQHSIPEVSGPTAGLDNTRGAPTGTSSTGIYPEANFSLGADNPNMKEAVPYEYYDERRPNLGMRRKPEFEMSKQERSESQASSIKGMQYESAMRSSMSVSSRENDLGNNQLQHIMAHPASFVPGTTKYMRPEMTNWPASEYQPEASRVAPGMTLDSQLRKENAPSQFQSPDNNSPGHRHTDSSASLPLREQWKPIPGVDGHNVLLMPSKNSDVLLRNALPDYHMDDQDASAAVDCAPSAKYTTFDYWVMDRQKRKFLADKTLAMKHQKTEEKKVAVCSAKLKESATSSEDINEKTKSVIELKKLKLLDLQRRLRSDIMNDYFKPISSDMDRLKSIKKHRIGRRSKQLERYEGKMKEERQKRMRERQKDFFSELEVHRERLEDVFKMRRERWKGLNKNVREFHKRKERIHREKIDRIQREKINLLKINDVEGYLRMVKDAKSDRVKQLLKETEKYLSKLGSKLQQAKNTARRFESDVDDGRNNTIEKNEISFENEDETDQAKHYLESNEKYYLLAHSVKETVLEQPAMLVGGKLREYQMNGLRWLVSLYNNHLNGILADEMGLGKTVQVISLLCHLMETKNDRGPFLVVVPSSVLPGWETEINFWAPGLQKIVYSGPPEERRKLFKEQIISQKFNVLLTTYEYLMNKHDRPKLSKVQWHYIIIDEGHRIKNASCKLNADLKHYKSNHRLLLTGTPLQNNLEELWALLNFLLPNIFNSSEDFSQWFNKPFESNGDSSADEALLSEEENLLIINRLHQVLRPFVLRRLKHKVENELPEKIERLIRCEASGYQKLLMKRVEDNLGAFGASKVRSVHNSVMELRNICNHPYLSQLHIEEVHEWMPKHYLPNIIRLCGKLEMLDRLLPKLKETDHRVLLFSTMTRLLDVMEDYLCWKQYKYLRLDGHTSGGDRGALIDKFNQPGSPFFIFLLSIRAGGVGVNLQAADTVIIFDTDWNPQVDLQAQARAHRIGQKKDVLVLRLETVQTVEEQVRASAEHKLGVANQSITAGFFDNNTSAEDRREYLESLLRECKKEEAAPVLDDDGLNDVIARSESEIDVFESIDRKRRAEEREAWVKLIKGNGLGDPEGLPPLPSRLLMEDELKTFSEAMKIFDVPQQGAASNSGTKRKGDHLGGLDTRHYGRGKRAREVRSYEEQLTEEEFERLCQVEGEVPVSPRVKQEITPRVEELTPQVKENIAEKKFSVVPIDATISTCETQAQFQQLPPSPIVEPAAVISTEVTPPSKRGRGRPRRTPTTELSSSPGVNQYSSGRPSAGISLFSSGAEPKIALPVVENVPRAQVPISDMLPSATSGTSISVNVQLTGIGSQPASLPPSSGTFQPTTVPGSSMPARGRGRGRKAQPVGEPPRRRGKRQSASVLPPPIPTAVSIQFEAKGEVPLGSPGVGNTNPVAQHPEMPGTTDKSDPQAPLLSASNSSKSDSASQVQVLGQPIQLNADACSVSVGPQLLPVPNQSTVAASDAPSGSGVTTSPSDFSLTQGPPPLGSSIMAGDAQDPAILGSPSPHPVSVPSCLSTVSVSQAVALADPSPKQGRGRGRGRGRGQKAQSGVEVPKRRGKRQNPDEPDTFEVSTVQDPKLVEVPEKKSRASIGRRPTRRSKQEQDLLNQSNALSSGDSPSITNLASDSRSEDKGTNSTKILFGAAPDMANSVLQPVLEDKENQAEKPIDVARTGVVQISEVSMTSGSKVVSFVLQPVLEDEENQAEKPTDGAHTGVVQISEASMTPGSKVVSSDLQPVLEDEENQAEKPTDGAQTGVVQISEASMTPGSKVVSSDLQPALEDKENQAEKPTDVAHTGVVQISEASMTSGSKVVSSVLQPVLEDEENQAEKPTDGAHTGVVQISEASMTPGSKVVTSDLQPVLEDKENQTEKPTDGACTGIVQISEALMTPDGKVLEEHETHKQTNSFKSDASLMMPDIGQMLASEVEQEHMVSKPSSCAESDPSPIISNPSIRKIVNEADRLININSMDAPHSVLDPSVVVVNKDLLQASVEENTPQNKSDPSIGGVDKVDGETKSPEEADKLLEMNSETSESVPRNVNSDKESVGHSDASVVISGTVAVSEHASEERTDAGMMNDVIESERSKTNPDRFVEEISDGTQKIEAGVQLDSTAVILKSDMQAENEDNAPNIIINSIVCHSEDPLAGVVGKMDLENEAKKETDIAMSSGRDAAEFADEMSKDQSVSEIERGSSSVTPVSDILHVGSDENAMNKVKDDKELLQGAVTISTPPAEDNPVEVPNVPLVDIRSEGGDLAAVSSFVTVVSKVETLSETILGEDSSKKIEQKGQLDGPKTTVLVNEDVAASSSELFNEISDTHSDKMAEEHENKENVPNRDSGGSVLCDDGRVAAISESLPSNTGDFSGKKDAVDSEIKATGLNKVPMLKHSTVTVSLQETPLPALGTMAPVVGQVDVSNTENKENEHADHPANISLTVEFPVQKQEFSEVTTGKADPEEVKNDKIVFEHGLAVTNDVTFSASDGLDVESQKDIDEKTSCDGDDELVDVISNSETCEMRPTGSNGKSEIEPGVGNASNAETSAETLKASEETTTINAEGVNPEKLETRDQTVVQKECLARVEEILPVDSQSSEEKTLPSDSVLETVNRVAPNAEVIEGRNTQNDTETDCPDNSLDAGDYPIGRNAPLSLQVASVDAAHAEVFVEEPGMMHKDSAIEVKGSEEVESEKIAVAGLHEAQTGATAVTSQPKNGLEQLVEEYSDED